MLKQHQYYIYHDGNIVYARMGEQDPVVAETLATPHDAYEKVQSIINPKNLAPEAFGPEGFNSAEFQAAISGNCEAVVKAAYNK